MTDHACTGDCVHCALKRGAGGVDRRAFLSTASAAALAAVAGSADAPAGDAAAAARPSPSRADLLKPGPQRSFSGETALQVAMPLGGIGAGCICLNGQGGLQDFSIRHRPQISAFTESNGRDAAFGVLRIAGPAAVTKVLEGPIPPERIYDQGIQSTGFNRCGHEGFPRFARSEFRGEYPFGYVTLADPAVPLSVGIAGWSPFIPLDDVSSSLPCALLEYTLRNETSRPVEYEFSFHASHLACLTHYLHLSAGCDPRRAQGRNRVLEGRGVFFHNTERPSSEAFGSAAVVVVGHSPAVKGMWLRSRHAFDSMSALWREVSSGRFRANAGSGDSPAEGRNGGSLLLAGRLPTGGAITYPIVIAWHFPNSYLRFDGVRVTNDCGPLGCCDPGEASRPAWKPYYASLWKDASEVAAHVEREYAALRRRTLAFKDALFSSTLPPYVLDAVSANLAILKSPTVLRQQNGNLWGWEGCLMDGGCCAGSCTHVWNYAQSLAHLFPALERTLRSQELERSMDESGHVAFRAALPDGPVPHDRRAAADGQLGGVMKVYRDWQVAGDREWLASMYPLARRSLEYAIRSWDPDRKGALVEPHHNTYDIEFWGADSMCTSIYVGALSAAAEMAGALGEARDAEAYRELAERGARFMSEALWNGEYFQQRVQFVGLRDTSFAESIAGHSQPADELQRLLREEGPKYQYGSGCLSDGVIGAWMAALYGIETPLDRERVRATLGAIFRHNFKADLSEHATAQRSGYARGREAGLLLCSWPRGGKPTLPFIFSDEVWTGVEYQVASHLIAEGFVDEGLRVVKALRSRYDGRVRNPWSEYESGNYYARAMASYALLPALSGFRYSGVDRTLWLSPRVSASAFRCFFSTATGFGQVALDARALSVEVTEGELRLERVVLETRGAMREIPWAAVARPGQPARLALGTSS